MLSQRLLALLLLTLCFLSLNIITTIADAQIETTEIFIYFQKRLKGSQIIEIPIRCPPTKLLIGKRCRTVF